MATKKSATKGSKKELPNKNGITRPRQGGQTGMVWDIADSISSKTRQPAKRADVIEAAEKKGVNHATAATQYGKWRRFNGVKREKAAPKAAAAKKGGAKKAGSKKAARKAPARRAPAQAEEQTQQSEE